MHDHELYDRRCYVMYILFSWLRSSNLWIRNRNKLFRDSQAYVLYTVNIIMSMLQKAKRKFYFSFVLPLISLSITISEAKNQCTRLLGLRDKFHLGYMRLSMSILWFLSRFLKFGSSLFPWSWLERKAEKKNLVVT